MDFNKIKEMGLEYAEKGRNAALDLAEKGRTHMSMKIEVRIRITANHLWCIVWPRATRRTSHLWTNT